MYRPFNIKKRKTLGILGTVIYNQSQEKISFFCEQLKMLLLLKVCKIILIFSMVYFDWLRMPLCASVEQGSHCGGLRKAINASFILDKNAMLNRLVRWLIWSAGIVYSLLVFIISFINNKFIITPITNKNLEKLSKEGRPALQTRNNII